MLYDIVFEGAHPSTVPVRRTEGIMITTATRKVNQAYWRGYAEADYDIAANGMSYAASRYMFGAGHGNAFWRGYAARAFRNSGKAARNCDCALHQGRRLRLGACAAQPLEGGDH